MSADIAINPISNRASMAYAENTATPWHGLGQTLTNDATVEKWIEEAGMNYEVRSSRLAFFPNATEKNGEVELGEPNLFPSLTGLYRSDNLAPLATVSNNYKVVQPKQVMEFFCEMAEKNHLRMDTAGVLRNGAIYWTLARMNDSMDIVAGDRVDPYVLLATSCDGTMATTAQFTSIRVVCQNTLSWAVNQKDAARVKVPHNSVFNEESVKAQMGLLDNSWQDFQKKTKRLAKVKVSEEDVIQFMVRVVAGKTTTGKYGLTADAAEEKIKELPNVKRLVETYHMGVGQDSKATKGTALGLVAAVSRFYDHETKAITQDSRLRSTWFGAGKRAKEKAVELVQDYL